MNARASVPNMPMPDSRPLMISFDKVSKAFAHRRQTIPAVDPIDFDIRRGDFIAFVGPSGCGKTTLLNLAAGLLAPDGGQVRYAGEPLTGANTRIGYLTQADALLPWRSILANVTLPLEIRRVARAERAARALAILDRVGLKGFERHYPAQLSGGMRKRAALARTLVYEPETLLLDEPFGALDAQSRNVLQRQLARLAEELGLTVVMVTHDLDEAVALARRIVVFSQRPARIVDDIVVAARLQPRRHAAADEPSLNERLWSLLAPESDLGAVA